MAALGVEAVVDDLLAAQLIDQVRFTGNRRTCFTIRRSARSPTNARTNPIVPSCIGVAAAIESPEPSAGDEIVALIAEHLEAAGDGPPPRLASAGRNMGTNRDIAAHAQLGARRTIADALPADDPDRIHAHRSSHHVVRNRLRINEHATDARLTNCGSCAPPPGTSLHWPSPWRGR